MNLLLLGRVNPLHVVDIDEYKGPHKGYKTKVSCTNGSAWNTAKEVYEVIHELSELLSILHGVDLSVKILKSDVKTLKRYQDDCRPYMRRNEKAALRRVLSKLEGE